ncbi:MAG: sigma-54-dependent Fis family transcriptional regulator [Candidatus Latescibacteria bacterium]|nr:sigma-54-dependent Fis family transcriptional regulator [Candidatus Latescibacterota bacterium]
MPVPQILVIAKETPMRTTLSAVLTEAGYTLTTVEDGLKGIGTLQARDYDVVLCNVQLLRHDTFDILDAVRHEAPDTAVIILTTRADTKVSAAALKQGAYDYIAEPFKPEEILLSIQRAVERKRLLQENRLFRREARIQCDCSILIGISPAIRQICQTIGRVAQTKSPVLICGESGTGKELVARAIHANSPRHERPLVTVNCGAIPLTLIESELFGHVRGAFTDAVSMKKGLFEEADGSDLFLDEIGELNFDLQVKLLRAIEGGEIRRVGDTQTRQVDVRIIAATNRSLEEDVAQHRFRTDLYYRLNVLRIDLPPLRERREDIPILAEHFLRKYREVFQKPLHGFTRSALRLLMEQEWPGNVRELEHLIERGIVMTDSHWVDATDLPFEEMNHRPRIWLDIPEEKVNLRETLSEVIRLTERHLITRALQNSNHTRAAELLGISRRMLLYKLKTYKMEG